MRNSLKVPVGLAKYNDYMGGVDIVDHLKGGHFNLENIGRCQKWTIKFFINLLGLFVVQAWCIYRHLYPLGTSEHLTREQFGLRCILHFWDHQYLERTRSGLTSEASVNISHECVQSATPEGSDNPEKGTRRRHGCCKCCKLIYNGKGVVVNKKTSLLLLCL
jgi:hypothetical protein